MSRNPDHEIRIFEFDRPGLPFIPFGITYDAASLRYTEKFYEPGTFEIVIPLGAHYAREFKKYRYVIIGRRFHGIILGVQYEAQADGDMLTVTGQSLLGLLTQRITVPPNVMGNTIMAGFDSIQADSETVIKHFITNNVTAPLSTPRSIPGFFIAENQQRGTQNDKYASRYDVLSDVIGMVGHDAKLGLVCRLDIEGGRIVFDVVQSKDRTHGQNQNPRVIFSINRGTVLGMTHSDNDAGMRNSFYTTMAGSEFEDEALTMMYYRPEDEADPPSGVYRREMHMEISADHPTPGMEYDELKRLALINMTNYEGLLSFVSDVNFAHIQYGRDYDLGDIVTVQNLDWGVTMDIELIGMTVEHTGRGGNYTAVFGSQKPNLIKAVKKAIQMG